MAPHQGYRKIRELRCGFIGDPCKTWLGCPGWSGRSKFKHVAGEVVQLLLCEPPGCMCECMGEALEVNILSQCLLPDLALSGDTAVFHRGGVTPELTSSLYTEWSMRKVGPLAWKKPSPTSHFSLQITPSWQSVHVFTLGLFIY